MKGMEFCERHGVQTPTRENWAWLSITIFAKLSKEVISLVKWEPRKMLQCYDEDCSN